MSIVPRILQVSVVVFSCSRTSQSILFVLVFGSGFLAAKARAIGQACSKHSQVSKRLLEGHKEPKFRFLCHSPDSHLRHWSRPALLSALSSFVHIFFTLSPNNLFFVDIDFSANAGTNDCLLNLFACFRRVLQHTRETFSLRSPVDWTPAWRPVTVLLQPTAAEDGDNICLTRCLTSYPMYVSFFC
jgi:hypothetical protein